jgi:ligand-binding SRPBCC domain-containing protein
LTYTLRRTQVIPGRLEAVFPFFRDPWNLEAITPPWLAFRILHVTDRDIRQGTRISYRLRLYGVPIRWETVIAEYEGDVSFADEMLRGPYRHWYHRHRFRELPDAVEMEDVVDYALPFGVVGRLVHALAVRRQLDRIFAYRAAAIAAIFGASRPHGAPSSPGAEPASSGTPS